MALPQGLKQGLKAKTVVTENGEQTTYGATCLTHSIVFRKDGKAVKTEEVPIEVQQQLYATMLVGVRVPDTSSGREVEILEHSKQPPVDRTETPAAILDTPLGNQPLYEASQPLQPEINKVLENMPTPQYQSQEEEEDDLGFSEQAPEVDLMAMLEEAERRSVDAINLKELVNVLYERFGIYTVYLNRTPKLSDINPLTGAVMNQLTLGQANQGFRNAQRMGTSWNPNTIRAQINVALRQRGQLAPPLPTTAMEMNQTVGDDYGQAITDRPIGEQAEERRFDRRYNRSFESPHKSAMYHERGKSSDGLDEDETYAEPPINARNSIVRPFKANQRSMQQLERISRERSTNSANHSNMDFNDLV